MSLTLFIRPEAESDIAEALIWYEERRLGLGARFLLSLETTFDAIAERPTSFPFVHHQVRRALLRRFPFGVFFVVENGTIVVLAVFHASRDPKQWKARTS